MSHPDTSTAVRYAGAAANWRALSALDLPYEDITPIATCHWQWIANILAADGLQYAWESVGLAWGCRARGAVLFGQASWPRLLRELTGAEVEINTYATAEEARRAELTFSHNGWPFVVEVDWDFLASGATIGHAVHAVLVVERDTTTIRLVDDRSGPEIWVHTAPDYERMRASPCVGRVEDHKLYVVKRPASRQPSPAEIHASIVENFRKTHEGSLLTLAAYVEHIAGASTTVDICRAAGERFQAAQTFQYLAEHRIPGAENAAALLGELSNNWYLAHMLTSHLEGREQRIRDRIVRIMRAVLQAEHELVEVLL